MWAVSSEVERFVDTEEVRGSIPLSPTIPLELFLIRLLIYQLFMFILLACMNNEMNDKHDLDKMDAGEKKRFVQYQKLIASDLKQFLKKKAYPQIAACFRDPVLSHQILAIKAFTSLYEEFNEETDKLLDVMLRSFLSNQKFVAITLLVNISFTHPDYAFPKIAKHASQNKELVEIVSDALKVKWQDRQHDLIDQFIQYWDLKNQHNLKKVAIMSLNPHSNEETDKMLDFLSIFMHESDAFLQNQIAIKIKDLYVREPYFVESKMREWMKDIDPVHGSQIVVLAFKEINKRQDPNLLDRTCLILENWSKNATPTIQETALKVLSILKERR